MTGKKAGKPTASAPIFVGSGPGADYAAEFSLTLLEWHLREEEVRLGGTIEGEISAWIEELLAKSFQVERHDVQEHNEGAVQREVMREAAAVMASPHKDLMQIMAQMADISSDDTQRIMAALKQGDISRFNQLRSDMVEKLHQQLDKHVTTETLLALLALGARCRAGRAGALCAVLYRSNPLSLIAQARSGDREAVLQLIRVDRLFLTDSCTAAVIRQAGLQNDHNFISRLARALTYKPRTTWRQGCRLYVYMLLSLNAPIPTLPKLQLRLDPDGTRFKTFGAFEKFVERSRKEFATWSRG